MSSSLLSKLRKKLSDALAPTEAPVEPPAPQKPPGHSHSEPLSLAEQRKRRAGGLNPVPQHPQEDANVQIQQAIIARQQFVNNSDAMAQALAKKVTVALTSEPFPPATIVYVLEMLKHSVVIQARNKISADAAREAAAQEKAAE